VRVHISHCRLLRTVEWLRIATRGAGRARHRTVDMGAGESLCACVPESRQADLDKFDQTPPIEHPLIAVGLPDPKEHLPSRQGGLSGGLSVSCTTWWRLGAKIAGGCGWFGAWGVGRWAWSVVRTRRLCLWWARVRFLLEEPRGIERTSVGTCTSRGLPPPAAAATSASPTSSASARSRSRLSPSTSMDKVVGSVRVNLR
jgi:hypothetical protein